MNFFIYYLLPFIIVLGVLVFFHELGHFLVAKFFNVKVLKFSLGFGYKVIGKKFGETEYLISTFPLGGYVKLLGEEEDEDKEISNEDSERTFNTQPVLVRMAIVAAGPIFNILLALIFFCGIYLISGNQVMTTEIGQVREDSPAARAGILKGDIIIAAEGTPIHNWADIKNIVKGKAGQQIIITVQRDDKFLDMKVVPEPATEKNIFGEDQKSALIGIVAAGTYKTVKLGPIEAVTESFRKTWEVTELTFLTIVKLFQRIVPLDMVGGPIMIGQMTGELAKENVAYLIPFTAVISINLAILNLLPIPILDGGLILFLLFELILRKPISIRKRDIAQRVGLFFLIFLMVFVFYNDISRLLK